MSDAIIQRVLTYYATIPVEKFAEMVGLLDEARRNPQASCTEEDVEQMLATFFCTSVDSHSREAAMLEHMIQDIDDGSAYDLFNKLIDMHVSEGRKTPPIGTWNLLS